MQQVTKNGVLVLTGYGISVVVERGHLCFEDGAGRNRRSGRLSRVGQNLKRLIVLGHAGIISFDALRWLHDIGAAFVQIDHDGQLISSSSPPGYDDAKLRRAQAFAISNGLDLEISRDLIQRKLKGQLLVVQSLKELTPASEIKAIIDTLDGVGSIDELRFLEARAAVAYWRAWQYINVTFVQKDRGRVPEHWLEFGNRRSLITERGRKATNPANAILNYLYAILESEARIAALTMGLDRGIGFMHMDRHTRDSLASDLMEAVRPKVDSYALDFLKGRAFKKADFFETREGVCRVMLSVSKQLMTTGSVWAKELGPIVEHVATILLDENSRAANPKRTSRTALPTLLTQANRIRGRGAADKNVAVHAISPSSGE